MDKKKLLELDREEFLTEITDNWEKHKAPTKRDDLAQYMVDKAFSTKSFNTLKVMSKDNLRLICIEGEEEAKEIISESPTSENIGAEAMEFLDDIKHDIHKEKFNPFVKKFSIKQIDKYIGKIKDENILNNLGFIGAIIAFILIILELVFKHGFKDIRTKIKEFKSKKEAKAQTV